ncbi:ABC transporter substrate-binding protein [Marasmitruncus massiliensis]|uniref:ABC transporter substrate-binding protein n=1 Tax=Marasmitruncus massiliensis TaxID=1944642 RepID=UPI000C79AE28|nr:ABC transporter substrate-binding protein [Marasmitruncus massiliensis]
MKRKLCALVLAFSAAFSGCSSVNIDDQQFDILQPVVSSEPESEKPSVQPIHEVKLGYTAGDSLNPYRMTTQINRELVPLLYDSLMRPDKTYRPENQLATEVLVEGAVCVVKFRKDAKFSDGTMLTGADIVYSINTAASSDTNWKTTLQNVASASVNADGDVVIQLKQPDLDFPALLSFPIIKDGTKDMDYPIGISKYFVGGAWLNGVTLTANPLYYQAGGNIQKITLVSMADPDAQQFSLKSGDIDMVYSDLSGSETAAMSTSNIPVTLNRLVYIGLNGNHGLLQKAEFRKALSTALNRDELVAKAYVTRARASMYPFNPEFYRLDGMELSAPRNLTEADALLDGIGLTERDGNGFRTLYQSPVTLTLLVNSDNACRNAAASLITEQLSQIGIRVIVSAQSFSQYEQSIASGNYDLYLGEVRLMDNMDFSLLLNGGSLGYAVPYSQEVADLYKLYKETGAGIQSLCDTFYNQSPFIPVAFRQGVISFNREFQAEIVATEQDIFYNIMEW